MAAAYLDVAYNSAAAYPAGSGDRAGSRDPAPGGAASPLASSSGVLPTSLAVLHRNASRWDTIVAMARRGINAPLTSSAGRLFDAVAAILGVRDEVHYEGQAAIELEQLADPGEEGAYHAGIDPGDETGGAAGEPFRASGAELVRAAVEDLTARVPREVIAARFHNGLAALIEEGCVLLRERNGPSTVALSGGVFQNLLLLERTVGRLEARGFRVLVHSRVPCNDGGISLGQAVVAAARDQLAATGGSEHDHRIAGRPRRVSWRWQSRLPDPSYPSPALG